MAAYAETRTGKALRWWQHLAVARLLEHDDAGRLVWDEAVISLARQLGKSWLLRELAMWRLHQGDRFGESQDVVHTGKDVAICKEVQRPARIWAKQHTDAYKVREVNGQEEIERLADGSRWMLRAKDSVYGYAASLAIVDEAWKVPPTAIDEGLAPTMAGTHRRPDRVGVDRPPSRHRPGDGPPRGGRRRPDRHRRPAVGVVRRPTPTTWTTSPGGVKRRRIGRRGGNA